MADAEDRELLRLLTDDPEAGVRGLMDRYGGILYRKLEAYNAPIGETVTDNRVSVTLDNISMDVSSMDIFLTISGDEAIGAIMGEDDYGPLWDRFWGRGPNFYTPLVNGKDIAQYDAEDWYLNDDGSLKLWRHYILTEIPEGRGGDYH